MPHRLEIALKESLLDAEGEGIRHKATDYFGLRLASVRTIHIVTIDAGLADDQLQAVRDEIFTNPVTHISSYAPLDIEFDWCIWVGFRPGVRDNPGSTAVENCWPTTSFNSGKFSPSGSGNRPGASGTSFRKSFWIMCRR
jgi:phosphoribosylformylglycinamidine synthase